MWGKNKGGRHPKVCVVILEANTSIPAGRLHDASTEVPREAARTVAKWESTQLSKQRRAEGVLHTKAAADGRHGHGRPRGRDAWLRVHVRREQCGALSYHDTKQSEYFLRCNNTNVTKPN